jgi:hypothetical protein
VFSTPNNCPECNSTLQVDTAPLIFQTCDQCHSTVFSDINNKEKISKHTETLSPIIVGSRGSIDFKHFIVTGCIVLFQPQMVVNCYFIQWSDGKESYLIENEAELSLVQINDTTLSPRFKTAAPGKQVELFPGKVTFCFNISTIKFIGMKGHGRLPMEKISGSFFCVFLHERQYPLFMIINKEDQVLLSGKFITLKDLNLSPQRF